MFAQFKASVWSYNRSQGLAEDEYEDDDDPSLVYNPDAQSQPPFWSPYTITGWAMNTIDATSLVLPAKYRFSLPLVVTAYGHQGAA